MAKTRTKKTAGKKTTGAKARGGRGGSKASTGSSSG